MIIRVNYDRKPPICVWYIHIFIFKARLPWRFESSCKNTITRYRFIQIYLRKWIFVSCMKIPYFGTLPLMNCSMIPLFDTHSTQYSTALCMDILHTYAYVFNLKYIANERFLHDRNSRFTPYCMSHFLSYKRIRGRKICNLLKLLTNFTDGIHNKSFKILPYTPTLFLLCFINDSVNHINRAGYLQNALPSINHFG